MKKVAIYNPYLETRGGGEKVCLSMAEYLSKNYKVTLISKSDSDLKQLGEYFCLDLSKCKHVCLDSSNNILSKISSKLRLPSRFNNLINEYIDYKKIKKYNYDIFINNCYKSNMPAPAKKSIYMCMFPQEFNHKNDKILKKMYHHSLDLIEKIIYGKNGVNIIKSYSIITANSSYTKSWIEKYWGLNKDEINILYPISENMYNKDIKKEKLILNVGRFFSNSGENHYKCQDKLLKAFIKMTDIHEKGWKLCLIGSVAEDIDSLKYLLNLYQTSRDFPVEIITNAPFKLLKEQFAKSSIYWHATGMGNREDQHPEKQEHFGITTVEAMSTGAVPVVINSAGQKETTIDGENGFLWNNEKELIARTRELVEKETKLKQFSNQSKLLSKQYNKKSFENSLLKIIEKI